MKRKITVKRKARPRNFIIKSISIRKDQDLLIKKKYINLSKFVQAALDKEFSE